MYKASTATRAPQQHSPTIQVLIDYMGAVCMMLIEYLLACRSLLTGEGVASAVHAQGSARALVSDLPIYRAEVWIDR